MGSSVVVCLSRTTSVVRELASRSASAVVGNGDGTGGSQGLQPGDVLYRAPRSPARPVLGGKNSKETSWSGRRRRYRECDASKPNITRKLKVVAPPSRTSECRGGIVAVAPKIAARRERSEADKKIRLAMALVAAAVLPLRERLRHRRRLAASQPTSAPLYNTAKAKLLAGEAGLQLHAVHHGPGRLLLRRPSTTTSHGSRCSTARWSSRTSRR